MVATIIDARSRALTFIVAFAGVCCRVTDVQAAAKGIGESCSIHTDCLASLRCGCPTAPKLEPPPPTPSPTPSVVEDYSSHACRSFGRTPLRQLLDASGALAAAARSSGAALASSYAFITAAGAAAADAPVAGDSGREGCTCEAGPRPPLPQPSPPPPPSPPPLPPATMITNENFISAVATCLRSNPVDGMCSSSEFGAMPDWDVSRVTSMRVAFSDKSTFNADISRWNTSSVTDTYYMFAYASAFDQPLAGWNTSSVTSMYQMFLGASAFNQDIAGWDTTSVTTMDTMFYDARAFDQDITGWSTPALETSSNPLAGMFLRATAWLAKFERIDTSASSAGPPSSWRVKP